MMKKLVTCFFIILLMGCSATKNVPVKPDNPGFDLADLVSIPLKDDQFETFIINSSIDSYSNNDKLRIFAVLYNLLEPVKVNGVAMDENVRYPFSQVMVYVVNCVEDKMAVMDFLQYSELNGSGTVSNIEQVYPKWSNFPKQSVIAQLRDKACKFPVKVER